MRTNRSTPLEEVLYEFSLAKPVPDAELLDEFVRLYPEHAAALTDLAVDIVLDPSLSDEESTVETLAPGVSPAVSRAMSRFQNRLFEVQPKPIGSATVSAKSNGVENPFSMLDRNQFRQLTQGLHCNNVFAGMLRDREIISDTMTEGFRRRVADELQAPIELVAAHFAASQQIRQGQFYKADEKPQGVKKVTFEEAVRSSGLTAEQQNFLLEL
jgi:hypothetical protein